MSGAAREVGKWAKKGRFHRTQPYIRRFSIPDNYAQISSAAPFRNRKYPLTYWLMITAPAEKIRINDCADNKGWKKWGPYLAERTWRTVREDYNDYGDTWNFVSHDMARA